MKKPKLNKKFRKVWIEALRSGKYNQAKAKLFKFYSDIDKEKQTEPAYCCLGVAVAVCGQKVKSILLENPSACLVSDFVDNLSIQNFFIKEQNDAAKNLLQFEKDLQFEIKKDFIDLFLEKYSEPFDRYVNQTDSRKEFRVQSLKEQRVGDTFQRFLSSLNDHYEFSFKEIADVIENLTEPRES